MNYSSKNIPCLDKVTDPIIVMPQVLSCSLTNTVTLPNYFYDRIIILIPKHDKDSTEINYSLISFMNINIEILSEIWLNGLIT